MIEPLRRDEFLSRQPAFKRVMMRMNRALGLPPIAIPAIALPMTPDELVWLLEQGRNLTSSS